ncbi:MAG: cell division topological specificity factor MinE [bacterium]|nr:cell division topological specificity factor MinE [bacterium]
MGLLTDFYNTVARFFKPQEDEDEASKSVATNRLKLVLMQDRTNLTPKILEQMRGELVDLLSKYLEMDKELLELNFEQEGDQVALMLSIPVIRAKDEEEIEEALVAQNRNKEADEDEFSEEESDEEVEADEDEFSEEESDEEVEADEDEDSENTETTEVADGDDISADVNNNETKTCKKSKKSAKEEAVSEI